MVSRPKRVPHGYVSQEAAEAIRNNSTTLFVQAPDISATNNQEPVQNASNGHTDDFVAEFERKFPSPHGGCKVCHLEDEYRKLIDTLLSRGAGGQSLSEFLLNKFDLSISSTTLLRHKRLHINARNR